MRKLFLALILPVITSLAVSAQYGNEWIDFSKTYYKFGVVEDGVYRIPASVLSASGLAAVPGSQYRLYRLGEEVAIYTSTNGIFTAGDYIEFVGKKNRGELDRKLYQDPDAQQLNPEYSMFTDTATYFLTWDQSGQGKRIIGIVNDLSNPPTAEPYYMHRDQWTYTDALIDPRNASSGSGISYSRYQEAEGFASASSPVYLQDISSSMIYPQGPDATFDLRFASSTYTSHNLVALFDADTLAESTSSLFKLYHATHTIPATDINASHALTIEDLGLNAMVAVSSMTWTYPRMCDFTGRSYVEFEHFSGAGGHYFEMSNFVHGGSDPVVIDVNAGVRLVSDRLGNTVRFLLPAFAGGRNIVVSAMSSVRTVDQLTSRTFTDYTGDNPQYIIITHPALRSGADVVGQYAAYRSSAIGGGYEVGVYHIQDIYDQFGFGVGKHPEAIRNFNRFLRDHWAATKMILIIGKGVSYQYSRAHGSQAEGNLLVPTFGSPGADHLLFTENGVSLPDLPVGRLPVMNQDQLRVYLSKVMEYDLVPTLPQTIQDKGWTKQILHMGGGQDADQQAQLLSLLNDMAEIAINSEYGATVSTFSKNSTNTTGQSNSDKIVEILHNGASVVKFFGHSSSSTLDFQINNPRDWRNKGKYPIFSAMGCKAGDIHQDFLSLSELFVFEPDAGTITFIAGSGSQYIGALGDWGKDWYTSWGNAAAGMTVGETLHESLAQLNQFGTLSDALLVEQQTLNGDPALRFYNIQGTDLTWDYKSVRYEPEIITTELDSFKMTVDIVNLGANHKGPVSVRVEQRLPKGTINQVFDGNVTISGFRTPVEFSIPIPNTASGLNTVFLTVDASNVIAELPNPAAEENNELVDQNGNKGFDIFILDNRAKATYPTEFSIVVESSPTLIANSTNAFVKGATFVMELDTTPEFNSPILNREFFSGFWGVLRWKPVFTFVPGTVYYWRVSTENGDDRLWDTSSFLYNPGGERGWNQSHYGQFQKDVLVNLDFTSRNKIDFDTVYRNIWVQNKVDVDPDLSDDPVVYINNALRRDFFTEYSNFDANVFVMAIDSFTGRFLRNDVGGLYGSVNTSGKNILVFPYNTTTADGRNALMIFLTDIVKEGMYAIVYSYQRPGNMDYKPEDWAADEQTFGRSIFSVIEDQASGSEVRSLETLGSVPYLLFYRKNYHLIYEGIANQLEETLSFDYNFISRSAEGDMTSTLIGPAKKWTSLFWDFSYSSVPANDSYSAQLVAVSRDFSDSLFVDITLDQTLDLSFIDAAQYPYMYLTFHTADLFTLTAAAVDYWRVIYEGMPDLLINPAGGFAFEGDTLMVGQPMNLTTSVENLGEDLEETVDVRFTITDAQNQVISETATIPPLVSGASTEIHLSRQTLDLVGKGSLRVEVNSDRKVVETTYLNNTGILNFVLLNDNRNPTLDVTFDGRNLLNGDIVSSEPVIKAVVRDDNRFLLLNNIDDFEILLRYPKAFDFTEIDLQAPEIGFEPATSSTNNVATLFFHPKLEDGFYDMKILARDRASNASGVLEYQITFEVLGGRLISRVEAQPTAFNDHTRFVFTVSGSTAPAEMRLEIVNVAGQIVREIGKDEIGLFVGTTEYIWDGTTDSGERLSGGVYFYRLTAKDIEGREYELTGPGFRSGKEGQAGKVIIVR